MNKKRKGLPRQTRAELKESAVKYVEARSAEILEKMQQDAVEQVIWKYGAVLCLVLHDKFGFGGKRLRVVLHELAEMFDSVNDDWCTFADVTETLFNETGIDMRTLEKTREIR